MENNNCKEFIALLEKNFSEWGVCLSIRGNRNHYRYNKAKGIEIFTEKEFYKAKKNGKSPRRIPNSVIQKACERFINAPGGHKFKVNYYGWPEWKSPGVDKVLTKYIAHPLRYWCNSDLPEKPTIKHIVSPEVPESDFDSKEI
ncbi:MAG: hypothetical protein KKD39_07175, partial [Candidatus Altiarchaeota archaeon]|nr:hypothetical protein [Candidatus Altiarchaeota archaeon]